MKEISKYLNRCTRAVTALDKLLYEYKDNGHYPPEAHISLDEIKLARAKAKRHRRELLELVEKRLTV